ncbi:oxidoreductase [Skermanella aerolata]|uniref:Oxidoreductase n=1 Tax=Skermanella aerolata TaxID=393310 RepID=A0A512DYK5_9PROT|nr:zinc-binding alcohol dehydrogenase family protein [Skermanella aerolata]KJB93109.1 oxidoreductase [Skermanella aerolata KACC 11604]GEO41558.1 oxidoreductase [Skermanella aerolata]
MTAALSSHSRMAVDATSLRLHEKAADAASVKPAVERFSLGIQRPDDVLVEIAAAGVNPSDVKAAMGLMPYAVFPRTPGRDFAGTVVDGPADLVGKQVFGSSGDLGIRRDGTHATHLTVEADAVVEKPDGVTLEEAAGIGVPFVTALEGLRRAGMPKAGDTVLVLGVNGKVGQAAVQIATWRGARAIGVVRRAEAYQGHATSAVEIVDSASEDVAARVLELTGGKGADIVYNTVGEPYYAAGAKSLAKLGRQIFIASVFKPVEFDIFAFYRGRHTYVGIDTLALSSVETADLLRELVPGFAGGDLRPFPIQADSVYRLEDAAEAYRTVLGSSRDRVILRPAGEG